MPVLLFCAGNGCAHIYLPPRSIIVATGTSPGYCRHMNNMNKTTNDNIEGRQGALYTVGDGLEELVITIDCAGDCDEPSEFDEMVSDLIANLEKALTAAKAVRGA